MGKTKIIIEMPTMLYLALKLDGVWGYPRLTEIIRNGTPLPKGHGDLIDRSTLEPDTEWSDYYDYWISYSYGQIADADIIIKADGGEEDEVSD